MIGETVTERLSSEPSLWRHWVSHSVIASPRAAATISRRCSAILSGGLRTLDRLTDDLSCGVAVELLGGAVPGRDDAVGIGADDRFVRRVD